MYNITKTFIKHYTYRTIIICDKIRDKTNAHYVYTKLDKKKKIKNIYVLYVLFTITDTV